VKPESEYEMSQPIHQMWCTNSHKTRWQQMVHCLWWLFCGKCHRKDESRQFTASVFTHCPHLHCIKRQHQP